MPPDPSRRALIAGAGLIAAASALPARAKEAAVNHVVLLGDSIFDNKAYVSGGPDVITQLGAALPQGWHATLSAIDGSTTQDIARQLANLPKGASHLVVSVGGNDALGQREILEEGARSVAEVLGRLAAIKVVFGADYARMLDQVTATGLPTTVCSIYGSNYEDAETRKISNTALSIFNDVVTRDVFARGLPLIDLRLIFDEPADYASAVEPSLKGGAELAQIITLVVTTHDFARKRSEVYAE
jgi:hypothetical protein